MKKISFIPASSWNQYSSQSPQHKQIEDWWKNNWQRIDGSNGPDYYSWASWYMDKFKNEWGRRHKGPEETLKIMRQESGASTPPAAERVEVIPERKQQIPQYSPTNLLRGRENVRVKSGVNIEMVSEDVKNFIDVLGTVAEEIGAERPIITSGYRSPLRQSRVMADNWKRNGGDSLAGPEYVARILGSKSKNFYDSIGRRKPTKGLVYLYNLYKDKDMAIFINEIFSDYGINRSSIILAGEYLSDRTGSSSHMSRPAKAIDLALTGKIKDVLEMIEQSGQFQMKKLFEKNHWHVKIEGGSSNKIANIQNFLWIKDNE